MIAQPEPSLSMQNIPHIPQQQSSNMFTIKESKSASEFTGENSPQLPNSRDRVLKGRRASRSSSLNQVIEKIKLGEESIEIPKI